MDWSQKDNEKYLATPVPSVHNAKLQYLNGNKYIIMPLVVTRLSYGHNDPQSLVQVQKGRVTHSDRPMIRDSLTLSGTFRSQEEKRAMHSIISGWMRYAQRQSNSPAMFRFILEPANNSFLKSVMRGEDAAGRSRLVYKLIPTSVEGGQTRFETATQWTQDFKIVESGIPKVTRMSSAYWWQSAYKGALVSSSPLLYGDEIGEAPDPDEAFDDWSGYGGLR